MFRVYRNARFITTCATEDAVWTEIDRAHGTYKVLLANGTEAPQFRF